MSTNRIGRHRQVVLAEMTKFDNIDFVFSIYFFLSSLLDFFLLIHRKIALYEVLFFSCPYFSLAKPKLVGTKTSYMLLVAAIDSSVTVAEQDTVAMSLLCLQPKQFH